MDITAKILLYLMLKIKKTAIIKVYNFQFVSQYLFKPQFCFSCLLAKDFKFILPYGKKAVSKKGILPYTKVSEKNTNVSGYEI